MENASGLKACQQEGRMAAEIKIYYGPSSETILSSYTVDLCSGGLFLKTQSPFESDKKVTLIFSLPHKNDSIRCEARVAWVNSEFSKAKPDLPVGVGLEFVGMSEDIKQLITDFLKEYGVQSAS